MAITAPVAGAYIGAYNKKAAGSLALGYTRQGFNLTFTQKGERIEETDLYGLSLIEVVYRGAGLTIDMTCKVYGALAAVGGVNALWPWHTTFGTIYTAALPIARLASTTPDVILLTAVANTPAATLAAPATVTASVVLSPDNANAIKLDSTHREVPLKFDCLLIDTAGTGSLFVAT